MRKNDDSPSAAHFSSEFLDRTVAIWQSYSGGRLSLRDAREITGNITGLFSLLSEWKEKDDGKEKRHESVLIKTRK